MSSSVYEDSIINPPLFSLFWSNFILLHNNSKCSYILMAEPDHVFVKPLPNLARGSYPTGFPFFYIKPSEHEKLLRKFFPEEKGPVTNIDPIGNSPVIIQKVSL